MIKKSLFIALIFLSQSVAADDTENHKFLYKFLSGTYLVVGKDLESENTYTGQVIFDSRGDRLAVTRVINGERITGTGAIEHALGPDEANVLRVRFTRNGQNYEVTYLWQHDLDNYARLSGYVYQPGKRTVRPGLEALFIDHNSK
jgi:hypothetical protein